MSKNITVIVKQKHPNIGNKGDVVKLSRGYIFNYLIPNNIVEIPTKGKIRHYEMFNRIANTKKQKILINAKNTKQKIENIYKIKIIKRTGDKQNIFGSINEKDIINEILKQAGRKIEKKDIHIPDIKTIGLFNISIKYINNEQYNLTLQVVPSNI